MRCRSYCRASLRLRRIRGFSKRPSYDKEKLSTDISDELIAQNENYRLEINRTSLGVSLTDLKTGKVYGTNPVNSGGEQFDEFGMPIKRHPQIESVLFIEYLDVQKNTTSKLISYNAAVQNGRTVLEKTDNGVKVEYYFDDAEIMIPITYSLRENGLKVTLDPKEIEEGGNMLISVSVAPSSARLKIPRKTDICFTHRVRERLFIPRRSRSPATATRTRSTARMPQRKNGIRLQPKNQ